VTYCIVAQPTEIKTSQSIRPVQCQIGYEAHPTLYPTDTCGYLANWQTYWLTYCLTNSPSWEAQRSTASQEVPCTVWNPKVHYGIHKCLPPVPVQSQINPAHASASYILKILIYMMSHPGKPTSSSLLLWEHSILNEQSLVPPILIRPHNYSLWTPSVLKTTDNVNNSASPARDSNIKYARGNLHLKFRKTFNGSTLNIKFKDTLVTSDKGGM
jgi:hypothetical protein